MTATEHNPVENMELTPRTHLQNKPNTISLSWKYNHTIDCSLVPAFITIFLILFVLTTPYWMSTLGVERISFTEIASNSTCPFI